MKIRLLFNGFRHTHVYSLYKKALASSRFEVVGCMEENREAREKAELALGARFSEESYETFLASREVDAVAIGGVYADRGKAVIAALRAGKHVIADKPICTNMEELAEIGRLSEEKGLVVSCMLDLRYIPQSVKAREILQSGRLGEVRNVSFNGQHYIDYPKRPAWYFEKGRHGGTLNDLAIHGVDLVRMITGLDFARTDAARTWNAYADRTPDFKDCATFMARLTNGAGVLADVSYSAPSQAFSLPTYWEFRFWCEKGMLALAYNDRSLTVVEEGRAEAERILCESTPQGYLDEFFEEIQSGGHAVTVNVLASTEQTLRIQQAADED